MPTFNRNDTNAILAFFGQTPRRTTQPRDEEYYTSNTPTNNRPASTRRPSSNVVTPTTAPGGLPPRRYDPLSSAYTNQPNSQAAKVAPRPAAPKVKRKTSQPADEEYYTNTDPPNRWRQEIQQPVFRGYDVGPQRHPEGSRVSVGQRPNTGPSAVQQSGTIGGQTVRSPITPRLPAYSGPADDAFYTQRDAPSRAPVAPSFIAAAPLMAANEIARDAMQPGRWGQQLRDWVSQGWNDPRVYNDQSFIRQEDIDAVRRGEINDPTGYQGVLSAISKIAKVGPVDAALGVFQGSPAYQYMVDTNEARQAEGTNKGFNRWADNFWTAMSALQIPQKLIAVEPVPGTSYLTGKDNISAGQFAGAVGTAMNRTLNPFNPNRSNRTWWDKITDLQETRNIIWSELEKSQQARALLQSLPPDQQEATRGALTLIGSSGGTRTQTAINNIINQDKNVTNLIGLAEARKTELQKFLDSRPWPLTKKDAAYAQTLAYEAADFGRQATELRKKTKVDFIDEQANVWGELMEGVFLDPTNYATMGPSKEAIEAMRAARLMNVPEKEAVNLLTQVMDGKEIPTLWEEVIGKEPAKWLGYVNPFNWNPKLPDTKAHLSTSILFRAATQLLTDTVDKDTARAILQTWVSNPRALVEGLQTPSGVFKVGGGVLANEEVIQHYNVLKKAGEALLNMDALKGSGGFNPVEVYAKMEDIFYKAAREVNGLRVLPELPGGAVRGRLRKTGAGQAVIEYLDTKGKILSTSAAMPQVDAEAMLKDIRSAAASAGGVQANNKALQLWGIQKAILSDMYLGMSPGFWLKNGLGFTVHMLTDDTYTLLPTKNILQRFNNWYGVAPTTATFSAAQGITGGGAADAALKEGSHWLERLVGKNPYSSMMNQLYKIPFGNYAIAGRLPISEENARLRSVFVPVQRYITNLWGDAVEGKFIPEMQKVGIADDLAKAYGALLRDGGINEGKAAFVKKVRAAVTADTINYTLKELGVPDELVSAEGWRALNDIFGNFLPEQAEEAAAAVRKVFQDEIMQPAQILTAAPPTPARSIYTMEESLQDNAELVDTLVDATRRAGGDVDAARKQGEQIAQGLTEAENTLWSAFREELAQSGNPQGMTVAMDVLAQWYDWRARARQTVDAISQRAVKVNTSAAWEEKARVTAETYGAFGDWFAQVIDKARADLLAGKSTNYNWFDVIQRYIDYDEEAVQLARTAGMTLKSPQRVADAEQWRKTIDAGREFTDKFVVEMFSAFRRYPTQDALDLVASSIKKAEDAGAAVARSIAEKRAELLPKRAGEFYKFRNEAWAQYFDNAAILHRVTTRLVVAQGVAEQVAGQLKWVDEFAGGEFQLVGKAANGMWEAINTETKQLQTFADPTTLAAKRSKEVVTNSAPEVPAEIVTAFYNAIGQLEPTIDNAVKQIGEEAAAAAQTVQRQALDEIVKKPQEIDTLLARGDALADLPAEQKAATALQPAFTPSAQTTPLTLNDLRRLADEAGIQTASEAGKPINKRLLDTINKDLKIKAQRLEDLTPDQIEQAAEALRKRAKPLTLTPPTTDFGMGVIPFDMLEWLTSNEARRAASNGYYTLYQGALDLFGLGKQGGDLFKLISGLNQNTATQALHKTPEIGEIAAHAVRSLGDAEKRILAQLPQILAGRPNTLTPAQQVRIIDALNQMLPEYDNILAGAARVGEKMGDFTMLNYNDRRLLDAILGFTHSYTYYWSRTPWNWIQRIAHKPGIVNFWYETTRAIERENEQNNIPAHLRGTLPNPLPVGPQRLGNPLTWLLPFSSYMGSDFVDPDEAKNAADNWMMYVQKYTPATQPIIGYLLALQQDMTSPLPNGKKRTDSYQLGDYVPPYRIGGYAYQAVTGNMGPQGFLAFGDEYDYGRAGKQVAIQGMRDGADPSKQTWALDYGYQQQTGADALPEQPKGIEAQWQAGAQQAGYERAIGRATNYLFGVPSYYLSPEEEQMRQMKAERPALGYDPVTNPYGSKAAVTERTGMDGDIYDAAFNYSQLYPGMPPRDRPGVAAARNDYWAKADPIFTQMNQAVADYVTKNPEATTSDVAKIRKPFFDQVAELKKQYPSAFQEGEGPNLPNTRYMNPREQAEYNIGRMLEFEPPNKPTNPGDEADPATLRTYYDAKAKWEKARLDQIDRNLNQVMGQESSYPDPWIDEARKLIKEKYSSELLRMYENRNATEIERHWNDRQTFVEEVEAAEWKRREGLVRDRLGDEALTAFQTYLDLEKGDPRKEYRDANPLAAEALFVAFNANAYDQFVQKFGEKGLDIAYRTQMPESPGDGASEEALQQYYKLRDAYNKKYPQAEEIRLWLWGRRFGAANGTDDYGVAHDEAIRIFGPDIFTVVNSFPAGGTKQEIAQWYKANPKAADLRNGYFAWKREFNEQDRATLGQEPEERPAISNAGAGQGYIGPRPVGEAYVPVGANEWWNPNAPTPLEQLQQGPDLRQMGKMGPPSRWDALSQEVYGTTQNPWTQRAGELNAALFQGATIPDQMGPARKTAAPSTKTAEDYAAEADKNYKGGRRRGRRSYYSRNSRYYSRGGRRYYSGGGGGSSGFRYPQMPDAQGLSSSLWSQDDVRAWRPWNNQANDWLRSGQELRPDRLEDWRPLRV